MKVLVRILFIFLGALFMLLVSCKKDDPVTPPPGIDFSKYRVESSITHYTSQTNDYYDTINYVYSNNGENIHRTLKYSNSPSVYETSYIKNGSKIDIENHRDGQLTLDGFYSLSSSGNVDTTYFWNHVSNQVNNTARVNYNSNQEQTRSRTFYNNYTNDSKRYYANGNTAYWIYDVIQHVVPSNSRKDSIVFEHYNSMPLVVPFDWALVRKFGALDANLVKKRTYYDMLNNNQIRQTYDYEYIVDADGLVTQEIWTITQQPSGQETRRDTTNYTYTVLE